MKQMLVLSVLAASTVSAAGLIGQSTLALSTEPVTLENQIEEGEAIFFLYCAPCHGRDARGGGPVAEDLKTSPPSLREIAKRRAGEFDKREVTAYIDGRNMPRAHGTSEMPVWGSLFRYIAEVSDPEVIEQKAQERISMLVKYLDTIQDK